MNAIDHNAIRAPFCVARVVWFKMSAKRKSNPKWENFKKKVSSSRSKKDESTPERDYITVQHLSPKVEGKWQNRDF